MQCVATRCGEVGVATSATVDMCLYVLHIDPVYMYLHKCYLFQIYFIIYLGFSVHRECL